jgi:hypothetical protein
MPSCDWGGWALLVLSCDWLRVSTCSSKRWGKGVLQGPGLLVKKKSMQLTFRLVPRQCVVPRAGSLPGSREEAHSCAVWAGQMTRAYVLKSHG